MLDIFSVTVVVIRGIALWIIASAISAIPAALAMLKLADTTTQTPDSFNLLIVIGALSHLLLAALLLIYAKKLARFATRGQENVILQTSEVDYSSLQAVAFSVLGAYILIYDIPTLLKIVAITFLPASGGTDGEFLLPPRSSVPLGTIVEEAARVAFGLWLVLGSKGMAETIRRIWARGESAGDSE